MDWAEMCRIEPKLAALEQEAIRRGVDPSYDTYEEMKNRMYPLVGWEAADERLSSETAWDIAIQHIGVPTTP